MERALSERTAVLETNDKNIFHQLDEIKNELHELQRLVVLCEGISAKLSLLEGRLPELERRLQSMESRPSEDLRHYRRSAVTSVITAVLAALLGAAGILFS